jgi:hypothetical protein
VRTPFGPQLIGETDKTLNAILRRTLHPTGLTEADWVALRLAGQLDTDSPDRLALEFAHRAQFTNAADLVGDLAGRGLLHGGRLTADARRLVDSLQAKIAETTAPIWRDLAPHDLTVATRVLNEVVARPRLVLDGRS